MYAGCLSVHARFPFVVTLGFLDSTHTLDRTQEAVPEAQAKKSWRRGSPDSQVSVVYPLGNRLSKQPS